MSWSSSQPHLPQGKTGEFVRLDSTASYPEVPMSPPPPVSCLWLRLATPGEQRENLHLCQLKRRVPELRRSPTCPTDQPDLMILKSLMVASISWVIPISLWSCFLLLLHVFRWCSEYGCRHPSAWLFIRSLGGTDIHTGIHTKPLQASSALRSLITNPTTDPGPVSSSQSSDSSTVYTFLS